MKCCQASLWKAAFEINLSQSTGKLIRNIVKSKYVVIDRDGKEAVIVFSPSLSHRDVAGNYKIKSAGFCELNLNGSWIVSGGSNSLECRSRPQDVEILNQHLLNGHFTSSINQQAGR